VPGEYRPRAVAAARGIDVDETDVITGAMSRDWAGPPPPRSAWRDPVTWVIAGLVFAGYFAVSLLRLLRLNPASYDLAIYTEYVKQLSQLHAPVVDVRVPGLNELGDHFQIAVGVLAPLFRLVPSPATLLFCQALATAISVFPVVTAGFALSGRATGRLIGFGYGLSWGLQQMVEFDFHEVALAVPLLAFSLSALVRRRPAAAIGWALPLVFVKEDQGFTVIAIGLLLAAAGVFPGLLPGPRSPDPSDQRDLSDPPDPPDPSDPPDLSDPPDQPRLSRLSPLMLWGGLWLAAWGMFWSAFAITVIIPHFNLTHVYDFWQNGGVVGGGRPFSLTGLLAQTAYDWPVKVETVGLLLLPTAFTALGSPVALLALPILALRFMSTYPVYWGTGWHYNATLMPVLFIAAADALGRWGPEPAGPALTARPALVWPALARAARTGLARHGGTLIAGATLALAVHFPAGGLAQPSTYQFDRAHLAAADAAMAVVPDGATVQANLDLLAPLAARADAFWIGNPGNPVTQYVVFDDVYSGYTAPIKDVPGLIAMLYPQGGYAQVFQRGGVYVFRRG